MDRPAAGQAAPFAASGSRAGRWMFALGSGILLLVVVGVAVSFLLPSTPDGPQLTYRVVLGDLDVTVTESGTLESSENTEIRCKVRGQNTITSVVESGSIVKEGEELLRLDTLLIEEQIHERTKYAHWCKASEVQQKAHMNRSELAVRAYLEGEFVERLTDLKKFLSIAKSSVLTAQNMLEHDRMMAERGYVSNLKVEQRAFQLSQSKMNLVIQETNIDVLKRFTKAERLERLQGELKSATAEYKAAAERTFADEHRRDVAIEEFKHCRIKAPHDGMVIHPNAARWKNAPEVREGATVYKNQILLLMPSLDKMQIKIGIHESILKRITPGLEAKVTLPDRTLQGKVISVAKVARPAGWWSGNVVKYDAVIQLPKSRNLKPGMSAEVEIMIASRKNVLTVPVAAIVETENKETLCWITTPQGIKKQTLQTGENNDKFVEVLSGLEAGHEVVLNPLAFIPEAQQEALKIRGSAKTADDKSSKTSKPGDSAKSKSDNSKSKPKPKPKPKPKKPAPKGQGVAFSSW
jgi:HlyD family secretion protein